MGECLELVLKPTKKCNTYMFVLASFFFAKIFFALIFIYSSHVKTGLLKYLNVLNTSELT